MIKEKPILSVVIPTKDRYQYLRVLLDTLFDSKSQEFEVIVQDNSGDNSEFCDYLSKCEDSRLIYNHHPNWLPITDNCDMGIKLTKGEYIVMLGDDDGVIVEDAIEMAKELKQKQLNAAVLPLILYEWPDIQHAVWGDKTSGALEVKKYSRTFRLIDGQSEISSLLNHAGAKGLGNLPRVYQGMVSSKAMNKLYDETGTYFPGPSPDMANAVGLTKYVGNYVYADHPIVIAGHSKNSGGGRGSSRSHHGEIKDLPHLPKDTADKWSKMIPFFWSGPTIYAESLRQALELTGRELDCPINYRYLYAHCFVYERHYSKEIKATIGSAFSSTSRLGVYLSVLMYGISAFTRRGLRFVKRLLVLKLGLHKAAPAKDIREALESLAKH